MCDSLRASCGKKNATCLHEAQTEAESEQIYDGDDIAHELTFALCFADALDPGGVRGEVAAETRLRRQWTRQTVQVRRKDVT